MYTKVKATRQLKAFTKSRKQTVFLDVCKAGVVLNTPSYWDGGSKSDYKVLGLIDGQCSHIPTNHPFFNAGAQDSVTVEHGMIVLKTGTFCGKPATPVIYATLPTILTMLSEWGIPELAAELTKGMSEDDLVATDKALLSVQQ